GERSRPETGAQLRHVLMNRRDVVLPVLGVGLLDRRQASVNLRQLGVLLGLRQGSVEGGNVDLALKIGGVAPSRVVFRPLTSLYTLLAPYCRRARAHRSASQEQFPPIFAGFKRPPPCKCPTCASLIGPAHSRKACRGPPPLSDAR